MHAITPKHNFLFTILPFFLCFLGCKQKDSDTEKSASQKTETKNIAENKMVWIPAGTFKMGTDDAAFADAQPIHEVKIKGYWMDEHEVTNAEFLHL